MNTAIRDLKTRPTVQYDEFTGNHKRAYAHINEGPNSMTKEQRHELTMMSTHAASQLLQIVKCGDETTVASILTDVEIDIEKMRVFLAETTNL